MAGGVMDFLITAFDYFSACRPASSRVSGTVRRVDLRAVVFDRLLETGVVVTPFLPGDSLLFAAGALAAAGVIDLAGDPGLADGRGDHRRQHELLHRARGWASRSFTGGQSQMDQTRASGCGRSSFYEAHGGKTVVMARFVPIVRTVFAPFVAGVGRMH